MTRSLRCVLFVAIVSASCVTPGRAATYTAASCNLADVQTAIRAEQATPADGDVIVIPASTCTWTGSSPISAKFNTSVTIQGAGAVYATEGGASTTGTDRTVIFDTITHSGSTPESLRVTTVSGKSFRLTGIAILQTAASSPANHAIVEIEGTSTSVRVDHCHFYMQMGSYQMRFDGPLGVLDHNYFEGTDGWGVFR